MMFDGGFPFVSMVHRVRHEKMSFFPGVSLVFTSHLHGMDSSGPEGLGGSEKPAILVRAQPGKSGGFLSHGSTWGNPHGLDGLYWKILFKSMDLEVPPF